MAATNLTPTRVAAPRVAGLSRFSTVDWPGMLVATIFLQGCPWDCVYCHNPDLIDPRRETDMSWVDVMAFLRSRTGLLDGVVFSGGEPTMQRALRPAIEEVRELGFAVGLHTAGAYPTLLARALPLVSWVGIDVKAAFAEYGAVTGRPRSGSAAERSLALVVANHLLRRGTPHPLAYEVRTTVHPDLIDDARLASLGRDIAERGATRWAVQRYRATGARSGAPAGRPLRLDDLPRELFAEVVVR
ncbi:anaerobic ribonucleoside-triphosphate reductase activating protein [Microbacterium sp. 18062]|uniref:anaerobic ribonucleoside-triphosphate reductase activating protein n=1 Tax=Microbacterium sp. 18062 TaxID=2681410 RepID=UPI0013589482|nr:anaerobic ribonucleoside-triphosphate reductase activating protein [Microbacterium sp. 18062]